MILILQLQKFDYKNNTEREYIVEIPDISNLTSFLECDFKNENIYHLYAKINQIGLLNFGHYTHFIKMNINTWYNFDDTTVTMLGRKLDTENAYILF